MTYRASKQQLGVMLKSDILKQNIDGEALLWARQRLLRSAETRRILMVISDGAPVEVSTLAANDANYLDNHLQQVIREIESSSPLELVAIGIGHDVSRYYQRAVPIYDHRELGPVMLQQLTRLLSKL